jgi:hypothetical protein
MDEMKIAHYYHAYAHPGWQVIVDEYLDALVGSGFHEVIGSLRLGVVGDPAARKSLVDHLSLQVPVTIIAEADSGWEQLTLSHILQTLDSAEVVAYAHTKSVTLPDDEVNVFWRRQMVSLVIEGWRDRVNDMASYDSAGPFQMDENEDQPPGIRIYGGNFWWARADLLRRLPPPRMEDRFGAEGWLGQVPHRMLDLMSWPL